MGLNAGISKSYSCLVGMSIFFHAPILLGNMENRTGEWTVERGTAEDIGVRLEAEECGREMDTHWRNMEREPRRKYAGQREPHIYHAKVHY